MYDSSRLGYFKMPPLGDACSCPCDICCPGPMSVNVNRDMTAHTLGDLEAERTYKVWMKSADALGVHSNAQTEPKEREVIFSG